MGHTIPTVLCVAVGVCLQAGKSVDVPVYDFTRHARSEETRRVSELGK